ncbi:MAG: hypothetical protein E7596_04020 [Ruminococcaceae bacterium]|nr:hypothetical protein [Oscillospiraceae bacterium]
MKNYISPAYENESVETLDVICASASQVEVTEEEVLDSNGNPTGETKSVATINFSALLGFKN